MGGGGVRLGSPFAHCRPMPTMYDGTRGTFGIRVRVKVRVKVRVRVDLSCLVSSCLVLS